MRKGDTSSNNQCNQQGNEILGTELLAPLWPQSPLMNDDFHTLKPSRHGKVIVREPKQLWFIVRKPAIAHVCTAFGSGSSPSLGLRELSASQVGKDGNMHLWASAKLRVHSLHAFDGLVHCRRETGPGPIPL